MITLSQSPTDPAFVQNPYAFYEQARTQGNLIYWSDYGMVCALSHAMVQSVLRDGRMGRSPPAELAPDIPDHLRPFHDVEAHSMLELEPPRHTRLRGLVLRAFTSRTVAALAAGIRALCHDLIDRFPTGPFDLLTHYAQPVPVTVIARLLGIPDARTGDLLAWSGAMVAMYQARRSAQVETAAVDATTAFVAFLRDHIAQVRHQPGDNLISDLVTARDHTDRLSEDELIATCILLLNAGHEATVHTIGNGVKTLLGHARLPVTPQLVEEVLRYDPPLHMFTRWVYRDLTLGGHLFRRGDQIACLLGAANRDPAVYDDPGRFDATRTGPPSTSFGSGIHFCVGAPLARLELQIALQVLRERCPDLELAEAPIYADIYHFHGLQRLMVIHEV